MTYFSKILLYGSLILSAFTGCQNDTIRTDVRFETDIVSMNNRSGKAFVYAPDSLAISLTRKDNQTGSYNFHYEILNGEGDFFIEKEPLEPGENKRINSSRFNVAYFPKKLGEHQIKFTFSNTDEFVTEAIYAVSVDEFSINIRPEKNTGTPVIDEPLSIKFLLDEKGLNDKSFNTTIDVLEGEGQITDVNPRLEGLFNISLSTRSAENYALFSGSNQLCYIPRSAGKHSLRLNIRNPFGYIQESDFNFDIGLPDFKVDIRIDTTVLIDSQGKLSLSITPGTPESDKEYYLTYRFLENTGKIKQDKNFLPENTRLTLKKGKHEFTFLPEQEGKVSIEFTVKDEFNSTKKGILEFNVLKSLTDITIKNHVPDIFSGSENVFSFDVKREGKYTLEVSTVPEASGTLTINDKNYTFGKKESINHTGTRVSFRPSVSGNVTVLLNLCDEKGNKAVKEVIYNVSEREQEIFLKDYSPVLNTFSTTEILFDVRKSGYTGSYQCEITTTPATAGKISLNGKPYTAPSSIKATGNSILFTPEKSGKIELELKVTDQTGGILRKSLSFTVTNSLTSVRFSGFQRELNIGSPTSFDLTVSKPGYSGTFICTVTTESSNGLIKVNGETSSALSTFEVRGNTPVKIGFTPHKTGEIPLRLTVSDRIEEQEYPILFSVSNPPAKMDVTGFSPSAIVNAENNFSFSLIKENYSGGYHYNITTTPAAAGTIRVNDKNYSSGSQVLDNPSNTKIGFTPAISGAISLNIAVTDAWGGLLERTFIYQAETAELQFRFLSAMDENINYETGGSFNFSVSRNSNYTGKYYLEIIHSGCKTLKINNTVYSSGKIEIADPANVPVRFLPSSLQPVGLQLIITDESGAKIEKKMSFNINNTDISLAVSTPVTDLITGQTASFSFSASEPGYTGKFKYKITTTPAACGRLTIGGTDYSGQETEIAATETVPVSFLGLKSGTPEIKILVKDDRGHEKSKSFSYTVTSPVVNIDVRSFNPATIFRTANNCYFSIACDNYSGTYKYNITTVPASAGKFTVADQPYTSGDLPLSSPGNSKLSFFPEVTGKIKAVLTVTNDFGDKSMQNLEYTVSNPSLGASFPEISGIFTVGKETAFTFSPKKESYKGRFFCEASGTQCSQVRINGKAVSHEKVEISSGSNTVSFTPLSAGKEAVSIHLKVSDEWGEAVEKNLVFETKTPETDLLVTTGPTSLFSGQASTLIFIPTQEVDSLLSYSLSLSPAKAGTLSVEEKAYTENTSVSVTSGTPVHVTYVSSTIAGEVTLKIKVSGKYGSKEKMVTYTVSNPPLSLQVQGFSGKAVINTPSTSTLSVSKEGYTGKYRYSITATAGTVRIDGKPYSGGKEEFPNAKKIGIEFTPKAAGRQTLTVSAEDELGGQTEKNLDYEVVNPAISVSLSPSSGVIPLNRPFSLSLSATKADYPGKLYCEVAGENFSALKVNGSAAPEKTEIRQGTNTVSFTPANPGSVRLKIKLSDDWGIVTEKEATFTVANPEIKLGLSAGETNIITGKEVGFIFTPEKRSGDTLSYKLSVSPSASGILKISGKEYKGGEADVLSGTSVAVGFLPIVPGTVSVLVKVSDRFGRSAEKTLVYTVNEAEAFRLSGLEAFTDGQKELFMLEQSAVTLSANREVECMIVPKALKSLSEKTRFLIGGKEVSRFTLGKTPVRLEILAGEFGKNEYVLEIADGDQKLLFPINFTAVYKYSVRQIPVTMTFTKTQMDNIDRRIDLNEADMVKTDFSSLSGNGFTWYFDKPAHGIQSGLNPGQTLVFPAGKNEVTVAAGTISVPFFSNTGSSQVECSLRLAQTLCSGSSFNCGYTGSLGIDMVYGTAKESCPAQNINATANLNLPLSKLDQLTSVNFHSTVTIAPKPVVLEALTSEAGPLKIGTPSEIIGLTVLNCPEYYNPAYNCQMTASPASAGKLSVKRYLHKGGAAVAEDLNTGSFSHEARTQVYFTPAKGGEVTFHLKVTDKNGASAEKAVTYTVKQEPKEIRLSVTNKPDKLSNYTRSGFHITAEETGYSGEFSYQIMPYKLNTLQVDGQPCKAMAWYQSTLQNAEVSFVPDYFNLGDAFLTIYVKDTAGNTAEQKISFSPPSPEYAEIPATFSLERKAGNAGKYAFSGLFQYYNYVMSEARQPEIGEVDMALEPNRENNQSQALKNVRVFKTADGRCRFLVPTQQVVISWTGSPEQKASLFLEVVAPDGTVIHRENHAEVNGAIYSGDKTWRFGSAFKEIFLDDYEAIKNAHIVIGYELSL